MSDTLRELNKIKKARRPKKPVLYTTTKPRSIVEDLRHSCNCDLGSDVLRLKRQMAELTIKMDVVENKLSMIIKKLYDTGKALS
jgi:hypothetical protein